jgi:hypothetical protein
MLTITFGTLTAKIPINVVKTVTQSVFLLVPLHINDRISENPMKKGGKR